MKLKAERLAALDLLRGIAALMVLELHNVSSPYLAKSYLAVDLFFVLSGFVLARAYGRRLQSGLGGGRFMLIRLIRLYPAYILGTLLGAALALLASFQFDGAPPPPGSWLASVFAAILFLPVFARAASGVTAAFPFDYPAWSLFWELAVNFLYIILARSPRLFRRLYVVIPLAIIFLGLKSLASGGLDLSSFWSGGARALLGFFAGVCIYRLHSRISAPSVPGVVLALILVGTIILGRGAGGAFDLLCAAIIFPLLVWLGAEAACGSLVRKASNQLGFLSYPIYILQAPLTLLVAPLRNRAPIFAAHPDLWMLFTAGFVIAVSWTAALWFDRPIRVWLNCRLASPAIQPAAEAVA